MTQKSSGGWDKTSDKVELIYGSSKRESRGLLKTIFRIIKKTDKNTFITITSHAHLNGLNGLLRKLGLLKTRYLVFRESNAAYDRHTGVKLLVLKFLHKFAYSQADLIICQTDYMKKRLLEGTPHSDKWNIQVIANPLPLDYILDQAKQENNELRKINAPYIVAAGRLIKLKGFDYLIDAFAQLKMPNLKLVILGEGPLRQSLENQAQRLGVADRIIMPGFIKNPMPYFKGAKLCVVSSTMEGFPNVLLQMMALNNRIVSTKCAGDIDKIPLINTCDTNSSEELLNAINKSLNKIDLEIYKKTYDEFLSKRTVDQFMKKMIQYLEK